MNRILVPLLLLLAVLASAAVANAAPRFNGTVRYDFANQETEVVLSADLIDDTSKENATGTLQVELWATSAPYESGQIQGHMLGSAKLEGLAPGQFYKNLRRTVPYTAPPRGTYYITMLLLEYRAGRYVIVEHRNFNNATVNLGPLPLFTMQGPWSYQVSNEGGTVEISVAKISHRRTGNTGALKLAVWVTPEPFSGGTLHGGFEIGTVPKEALKPGFSYTNVKNVAKYLRPPPGDYYATLVLYEWDGKEFVWMTYLAGSGTVHLAAP
jgi:hypothetical protein